MRGNMVSSGFKIQERDESVFSNSEPETLCAKKFWDVMVKI